MTKLRHKLIRAGLDVLCFSGLHHFLRPFRKHVGAIFTVHHVRDRSDGAFQPNRHLEITPQFLRASLAHLRRSGIDILSMDEVHERTRCGHFRRPFAALTFDDGYRDFRDLALPLLREFDAPATLNVAAEFAEGRGTLWWIVLETVIRSNDHIELAIDGADVRFDISSPSAKERAFARLHGLLRHLSGAGALDRAIAALCQRYHVEATRPCRELCLSWEELRDLAQDPLVTIGAHSFHHRSLALERDDSVIREMAGCRIAIEQALQCSVRHFAYPYGDGLSARRREFRLAQECGFTTAVTTRPGVLSAESVRCLTALPRLSLNGNSPHRSALTALTSGAAGVLWNRMHRQPHARPV